MGSRFYEPGEALAQAAGILRQAKANAPAAPKVKSKRSSGPPSQAQQAGELLGAIEARRAMGAGIRAMREREREFSSPLAAMLAGVAVVPEARRRLEDGLDKMWSRAKLPERAAEVVIGGGLHAAIYCAVRRALGYPPPLVLERGERVGGAFAVSRQAAFLLNSRNRPGPLSIPGAPGSLNVLPAGALQPSDISGDEYQRNTDLAFCIRLTLAMAAEAVTGEAAVGVTRDLGRKGYEVQLGGGRSVGASRVIVATGLGEPRGAATDPAAEVADGRRVMTFAQLMAAMDEPFPLRGMGRVAVVGAGDSGRTAVEALTGQGPSPGWSVASIDWPERIDWYGVAPEATTRQGWEACNRSRYRGIGRLLASNQYSVGDQPPRVFTSPAGAAVGSGYDCAYVNERSYDCAILCTGYQAQRLTAPAMEEAGEHFVGGRAVARRSPSEEVWIVGPAAGIPIGAQEAASSGALTSVPENSTSLFRYAGRTAALAAELGKA